MVYLSVCHMYRVLFCFLSFLVLVCKMLEERLMRTKSGNFRGVLFLVLLSLKLFLQDCLLNASEEFPQMHVNIEDQRWAKFSVE